MPRRGYEALQQQLANARSPCEAFDCRFTARCAQGLACAAFRVFASSGRLLNPAARVEFDRANGRGTLEGIDDAPAPTQEHYAKVFWLEPEDESRPVVVHELIFEGAQP